MNTRQLRGSLLASCLCVLALCSGTAAAQTTSQAIQVLDRVAVFGTADVLEMAFDKPDATGPYEVYPLQGSSGFQACQLTTIDGLYCLDGQAVRHWADPLKGSATDGGTVFSCNPKASNSVPGLIACTGMTVDDAGAIWLAGQNKSKTYNLVKVVAASSAPTGACPASTWQPVPNTSYYACSWATGRPLLVDIMSIDGDAAQAFTYGAGIVGLEQRKTVTFFPANPAVAPFSLGSGKTDWGLSGNEQLENVAVLPTSNVAMVTTTAGRLLSRNVATATLLTAIPIPVQATANAGCPGTKSPTYAIRSSFKTGIVYVTDDTACEAIAMDPSANSQDPKQWTVSSRLSTAGYSPVGVTLAAGIGIDMTTCDPATSSDPKGCQPVSGAWLSIPTATLVPNGASGLTLFQVTGIPDCRWNWTQACTDAQSKYPNATIVVKPGNTVEPSAQYLNVRPLLPEDVQKALAANGVPPDEQLLISPNYRGQLHGPAASQARTFDAFFGVPQKGVQFQNTFGLEFQVSTLAGSQEGCQLASSLPSGYTLANLLAWDVATKVSETTISGDAQSYLPGSSGAYVDTLVNTSCGSSKGTSFSWSLVPYNLEVTPDTVTAGSYCPSDPSVFAHLLGKLFDDLNAVTRGYACASATGPIDAVTCSTLESQLANAQDKLQKCLDAAYQPKTSAGSQNCQSFVSQFAGVASTIDGTLSPTYAASYPNNPDPDNRRGELKTRVLVVQHVFTDKFLPSVPSGGFTPISSSCPAPVTLWSP